MVGGGELADGAVVAGKYRVVRALGAGAAATVYEATHMVTRQSVALKVLHPALSDSPGAVGRFLREAQLAARIEHPNVAEVRDAGQDGESLFLAMRLVEGESLRAHLARRRFTPYEVAGIGVQLARGVGAAHERGIVHRDLKPANVMMEGSRPRIIDFGVSKLLTPDELPRLTASGIALGTPHYAAPEQLGNAKRVDERADIYSVGAILYELLVGHPPYAQARSLSDLVIQQRTSPLVPVVEVRSDLPPELSDEVMRALEMRPDARHPDALSLERALRRAVGVLHGEEPRSPPRRTAAFAVAALALAALAIAALAYVGSESSPPADAPPVTLEHSLPDNVPRASEPASDAPHRSESPAQVVAAAAVESPAPVVRRRAPRPPRSTEPAPPEPAEPAPTEDELSASDLRTRRLSNDEF